MPWTPEIPGGTLGIETSGTWCIGTGWLAKCEIMNIRDRYGTYTHEGSRSILTLSFVSRRPEVPPAEFPEFADVRAPPCCVTVSWLAWLTVKSLIFVTDRLTCTHECVGEGVGEGVVSVSSARWWLGPGTGSLLVGRGREITGAMAAAVRMKKIVRTMFKLRMSTCDQRKI